MNDFKLISDYKNIDKYRLSFNKLATDTFRVDFEDWYKAGFWNDNYVCYSYIDNDEIISNISISKMNIIWQGKNKKAIQLGAVMTHPAYRNSGLSANLMDIVLKEYEKDCDFIYLFANKSVLDFYPKFGFKPVDEICFSTQVNSNKSVYKNVRKLRMNNNSDLNIIIRLASVRKPISKTLGLINDYHLILFYCQYVFNNDIYYFDDKDTIVIYKIKEDVLHIYDVLSSNNFNLKSIINRIVSEEIKKVIFHFVPDFKHSDLIAETFEPIDKLFIKPISMDLTGKLVFPETSHG